MENRMGFFVKDWQMRYPRWRRVRSNSDESFSVLFSIDKEKKRQEKEVDINEGESSVFFLEENQKSKGKS